MPEALAAPASPTHRCRLSGLAAPQDRPAPEARRSGRSLRALRSRRELTGREVGGPEAAVLDLRRDDGSILELRRPDASGRQERRCVAGPPERDCERDERDHRRRPGTLPRAVSATRRRMRVASMSTSFRWIDQDAATLETGAHRALTARCRRVSSGLGRRYRLVGRPADGADVHQRGRQQCTASHSARSAPAWPC